MIRIQKIGLADNPRYPTAADETEYSNDVLQHLLTPANKSKSPYVDYWVAGKQLNELKVGEQLFILRYVRNGKKIVGNFSTSRITEIFDGGFKTQNSVYTMRDCTEEEIAEYSDTTDAKNPLETYLR